MAFEMLLYKRKLGSRASSDTVVNDKDLQFVLTKNVIVWMDFRQKMQNIAICVTNIT